MTFLEWSFYGNTLQTWIVALLIGGAAYVALHFGRRITLRKLRALADRTMNDVDDIGAAVLGQTRRPVLAIVAIYLASRFVYLPEGAATVVRATLVLGGLFQAALWGNAAIAILLGRYLDRHLEKDPASATTIRFLGFIVRIGLWAVVLLLALANLGFEINALIAGLGVGGIAVALALQNILGDLFASLSILLDKPFVIGDFIIVGDLMGTVEYVGLKTTRVRSLSGEQIVFANADLLQSRVRNFKRMFERRVVFSLGVTYDTPYPKLAAIPGIIREIVEAQDRARFDRAHFQKYGAFSLDYEIVYYVLDPDYNLYMDTQQAINLEIFRRFAEIGVEFAFPTQTLHLQQAPAPTEVAAGQGE